MRSLVTLLALVGNAITFPLSPGTPNSTLHSTGLSHPSEPPARDECTMSLAECFSACHMLEFSCIYDCQYTVCELEDVSTAIHFVPLFLFSLLLISGLRCCKRF